MSGPTKKGWCPGALRPMPTGDGLLVRVRPSAGRLTLEAAAALAALAQRFGNGKLEISLRANLQMRGFSERDLPQVWERLGALGVIDDDAEVEAIRNIVASPLSDIDPQSLCDVSEHVAALEAALRAEPRLRRLPAKFGFAIDAGGRFGLDEVEADVTFRAARSDGRLGWEVSPRGPQGLGSIALGALAETASKLALVALESPRARRRAERDGASKPAHSADFAVGALALGDRHVLIAAPPLGRMTAPHWAALVEAGRRLGAQDCRLMPGRRLALTGVSANAASRLAADAAELGFIVDPDDPRLSVVACAGKPGCASAARDVQADALALASALHGAKGVALHVSGCAKGCARAQATPLTLVAQTRGYAVIFDGRADAAPQGFAADLDAARRCIGQTQFAA